MKFTQVDASYFQLPEFESLNQEIIFFLKEFIDYKTSSPTEVQFFNTEPSSKEKKVYILFGLSGSGKSTTGNCIYNKSGILILIKENPFPTSDNARSCTDDIEQIFNKEEHIIDTVDFLNPNYDHSKVFKQLKIALNKVNNKVDCVLFCVEQQRFTKETVEFFKLIQSKVLKKSAKNNSVLIVTKSTHKNWVKSQNCEFLNEVLKSCDQLYHEFSIKFDYDDDNAEKCKKNETKRQNSILDLVSFLNSHHFKKLDLDFVQSEDYEKEWLRDIIPELLQLVVSITKFIFDKS